jgi:DNA sulfur modification protein DndB
MDNRILLPAIKGIIGDWVYYQTVMPFHEVVNRIDNDHSIREYKSLDDYLQRDLSKRSKKISNYLLREQTRFFNSAIIGIFGGNPNWYNFAFGPTTVPDLEVDDFVLNTIGILELSGGEKLFSIDGQHRVEGIKQALAINSEKFQSDELPIVIVAHRDSREGKIRTRRLFSEINTKAVKVSGLDDLITNEDNPVSINARRFYAEFEIFEQDKYIQLNHTKQIRPEATEFTTIICLESVNQILYEPSYKFNDTRPSDETIELLYQKTLNFWSYAVENISTYRKLFIEKTVTVSDLRNKQGGSMLLRPIGIEILASAYINWITQKETPTGFWEAINRIDDDLQGEHWNYVLWDASSSTMSKKTPAKFNREYMKDLLGLDYEEEYVVIEYSKLRGGENRGIEILALPIID